MKIKKRTWSMLLAVALIITMSLNAEAADKVKLSKTSANLYPTESVTLKVNGTKSKVKWSSSNKKVAKVTSKGKVTAIKQGKATITAKIGKKSYACKIKVKAPALSEKKLVLGKGYSDSLKLYGTKIKSISSSNKKIATVDKKGKIKGKKIGECKITVIGKNNKKYICKVKVVQPVTDVQLDQKEISLNKEESVTLKATVLPSKAYNKKLIWKSSNESIAKVNEKGKITAIAKGTAVITVKTTDKSNKKASCKVIVHQSVSGITLSQTSVTLKVNETSQLTATIAPEDVDDKEIKWESNNADVVSIDATGKMIAKKKGTAVITAKTTDGSNQAASCVVTVIQPVSGITISHNTAELKVKQELQLTAAITPENANNQTVQWKSSNTEVATVSNKGKVTALAKGTAVITALSEETETIQASCTITVIDNSKVIVHSQEELNSLFNSDINDLRVLNIESDKAENITIPDKNLKNVVLNVNTPNGEVINKAQFNSIIINAIAEHTYIEQARGNQIFYLASRGTIRLDESASARIEVSGGSHAENTQLNIVNNGTLYGLTIDTISNITLTTENWTSSAVAVNATANAAGTSIATSQNLALIAESRISLQLNEGSEETRATITNSENIPSVMGLGSVTVTNTETNEVETVVAENSGDEDRPEVKVSGRILDAVTENVMYDVAVYAIKYTNQITKDNISEYLTEENKMTVTDEEGKYSFNIPIGNYYLVVSVDGYKDNIQTLVVTSVNEEEYVNEDIRITLKGEDGALEGVITDAATGSAIDFPVVLKIREGQNNLTGTAYRTVAVDVGGRYDVKDLPVGVYTIQVLSSPESDVVIASTSFSVTITDGETVEKNHTVTKQLGDGEIRFQLRWAKESDSVPRDLDSHLVGPGANGDAKFHVYYSDDSYYSGDERYVDLDVDDTTWEGPETTTIYKKCPGLYSFYIFNFTDQGDEYSTRMSNNSQASVKVFEGDAERQTFTIPTGQAGNLWHVCDYDSNTGMIIPVNKVGYWPDGGSSTVGQSEADIIKQALHSAISNSRNSLEYLEENDYKAQFAAAIENANAVYETSENVEEIRAAQETLVKYMKEIRMLHPVSVEGSNFDTWYYDEWDDEWDYDERYSISLKGSGFKPESVTISTENANISAVYEEAESESYVGTVVMTDTSTGAARKWYIYYQSDMFDITSITGDYISDYELNSGSIDIYGSGLKPENVEVAVKDSENVVVVYTEAEEINDDYIGKITATYTPTGTKKTWLVYYYSNLFDITSITGDYISDYDLYSDSIYIYGSGLKPENVNITVRGEDIVTAYEEVENESYVGVITATHTSGKKKTWNVYYYSDMYDIKTITGQGVVRWSDEDTIYIWGTSEVMPEITVTAKGEGVTAAVETTEDGILQIRMTYGESTRIRYVEYCNIESEVRDLVLDTDYQVVINDKDEYFAFTPEITGIYSFYSMNGEDPKCTMYLNNQSWSADDELGELQFCMTKELIAGQTYYFKAGTYEDSDTYTVRMIAGNYMDEEEMSVMTRVNKVLNE